MSSPYGSLSSNASCARTLIVATGGTEADGCMFCCGVGIGASASSYARIMFYMLIGVVICRGGNGEDVVKGTCSSWISSVLGRAVTANVAVATFI